jgi:hypothetical protein
MALRIPQRQKGPVETSLRAFDIQSAAELGRCTGAQSFRAVSRDDGAPVLLHKFRPASSLLDLDPVIDEPDPPDFDKPFVTRFTGIFAVAGSAYLVEPLPVSFDLAAVWRCVLASRPQAALPVAAALARHLLTLVHRFAAQGRFHGALTIENIVLTPAGRFGALTASVPCTRGRLWLRKQEQEPVLDDLHALAAIVHELLDLEAEIAYLRNTSMLLEPDVRDKILRLAHNIEQTGLHVGR